MQDGELAVELVDEFVSLAGTIVNCAGGPTPWGSWLSCEETLYGPESGYEKPHGYVFEVPVHATGPVDPVPLRAMGRFVHEAVAVDPATGIVYQTEDRWENESGLLSLHPRHSRSALRRRQTSDDRGDGTAAVRDQPGPDAGSRVARALGRHCRSRSGGLPSGFRGGRGAIRAARRRFSPETTESTSCRRAEETRVRGRCSTTCPTSAEAGELRLVFESPSPDILDSPDNIVLSPHGGLLLCEDGSGDQFIRELDGKGQIVNLVRGGSREFAGSCFSADGRVLFFNVQGSRLQDGCTPSATYALWRRQEGGNQSRQT